MEPSKVEIVNKSFDKLVTKLIEPDGNPMWNVLIPLLIGALLTFVIQFFVEFWKTKKERKDKIRELKAKAKARTYLIAQIIKDLAMYKTQKQYYIRACIISTDKENIADSFKKHYDKANAQRETECKLDENIAEFFEIITEYLILTKYKNSFEDEFEKIFNYDHPKAETFENCKTSKKLQEEHSVVEKNLNIKYQAFIDIFTNIQKSM